MLSIFTLPLSSKAEAPTMTQEELTKAREVASQIKPPVDFDLMMAEAKRLGVECGNKFEYKYQIKTCSLKVDNAQIDERTMENLKKATEIAEDKQKQIDNN